MLRIYLDTYPEVRQVQGVRGYISYMESDHELFCTPKALDLMEAGDLKETRDTFYDGLDLNQAEVSGFYGDRQKVKDKFELLVAKNAAQLNEEYAWEEANEITAKLSQTL